MPDARVIPADVQVAAKRGFVRTTFQAYAATLAGGVSASAIISAVQGGIDPLTVGVTMGVAVLSPPLAGLASYLNIASDGIPDAYQDDVVVVDDTAPGTGRHRADGPAI